MNEGDYDDTGAVDQRKLRHWAKLAITDPRHTKPFQRPGGFRGTAIRPIWTQYRLTEHFGPAGLGWGFEEPRFEVVTAGDEMLVYCTLRCWYRDDSGERAFIYGVGGDKVLVKRQSGNVADDEAFKKALTDAIGNAFVKVGLSADVHMGLFEDSKYVASAAQHFREEDDAPAPPPRDPKAEISNKMRELQAAIDEEQDLEMLQRLSEWPAMIAFVKLSAELGPAGPHQQRIALLTERARRRLPPEREV